MRKTFAFILSIIILLTLAACSKTVDNISQDEPGAPSNAPQIETTPDLEDVPKNDSSGEPEPNEDGDEEYNSSMTNINITVGNSFFTAKLYDNDAASALMAQFPMTLDMSELNGNEKCYYLADNLPSESTEKPATMNTGDIMCWSGNCLVLFYKTFSNSYGGYVRLGYIEDTSGFTAALGNGGVQVTFAVSD